MGNDTQRILDAIKDSGDKIGAKLDDHELRIRNLEKAVTVHGMKIGAIVAVIMAFGSVTWNVIKDTLGWK